ncbi:2-hydroxy-6-oxononadienedioate/2-hydroxy-6-oxononatrienedioate hydrolase [Pigmentiphaga humi]|uniref:2-hydroxy-6-oxononadienedioate/2-hydroxy-6-oxononatrienedioate hydrolase n=1 Tax=Pigmentiphaga humi TaxID=2478468 RepID=A0A3P4B8V3_9BURK|nr:alpha/beta hydrolase [Pigmentiphaga humi]VCU72050.1 2-hydroxy-6-oxononadienedioate/2-hydroxy-6-oxononatrienedioate hydrolase [Pigmentiphaga humi]
MNETLIERRTVEAGGVRTEIWDSGTGEVRFLFLHPERGLHGSAPFLRRLAQSGRVIAPYHPGFRFDAPVHFRSMDDLSYFYLDLMEALDLRDVTVVGASLGGWLAMEIASMDCSRIASMCLVAPAGVKVAGRTSHDMRDIFSLEPSAVETVSFHDPGRAPSPPSPDDAEQLELAIRAREASARYAWLPYMHNPKLGMRLHRIRVPSLVLWGSEDRIASPSVGEVLARRLPAGTFRMIEDSGHYPHIEQDKKVAAETAIWRERHERSALGEMKGVA